MQAVIPDCPQPEAPVGHAVQYPLTLIAYYGPCRRATGCVWRDACGTYWVTEDARDLTQSGPMIGLVRHSHIAFALDYANAHHEEYP